MNPSFLDLAPLTTLAAKGAAQLPAADDLFIPVMQSLALLAVAVAAPITYHPGLYAGSFLLAMAGATYTFWRTRLAEQTQDR